MGRHRSLVLSLALASAGGGALAQSSVTVYGRVDLSLAQQADAPSNKELRNGSGSRLGFKGVEDLGDGFKAFFHLEHRFNANDGTLSTSRFWEGKSIVGLEHWWGRVAFGREENPAYTFSQAVADPWGNDTVASNASIINGRIGSTRYSNTANYRHSFGAFSFGAQIAEAAPNVSNGANPDKRPYSFGAAYVSGPWTVGVGYENPPDRDDHWTSANVAYDFGVVKVGAFAGSGKNTSAQRHRAWLVSAVAPVYRGELRASVGQLKNRDLAAGSDVLDEQVALGYFYPLSKRTTVYADIVHEGRDNLPSNRKSTGYDIGLKHNF